MGTELDSPEDYDSMCVVVSDPSTRSWAPPSFHERTAFRELVQEGLAILPPEEGVGIRYHKGGRQWHGFCARLNKHTEPSWGSLRSERKAILIVLKTLWTDFIDNNPNDTDAKEHLEALKVAHDSLDF